MNKEPRLSFETCQRKPNTMTPNRSQLLLCKSTLITLKKNKPSSVEITGPSLFIQVLPREWLLLPGFSFFPTLSLLLVQIKFHKIMWLTIFGLHLHTPKKSPFPNAVFISGAEISIYVIQEALPRNAR